MMIFGHHLLLLHGTTPTPSLQWPASPSVPEETLRPPFEAAGLFHAPYRTGRTRGRRLAPTTNERDYPLSSSPHAGQTGESCTASSENTQSLPAQTQER